MVTAKRVRNIIINSDSVQSIEEGKPTLHR